MNGDRWKHLLFRSPVWFKRVLNPAFQQKRVLLLFRRKLKLVLNELPEQNFHGISTYAEGKSSLLRFIHHSRINMYKVKNFK